MSLSRALHPTLSVSLNALLIASCQEQELFGQWSVLESRLPS